MTVIDWLWQSPSSLTILILFSLAVLVLLSPLLFYMVSAIKERIMRHVSSHDLDCKLDELRAEIHTMHRDLHVIIGMLRSGGRISVADQARVDEIFKIEKADTAKINKTLK